MALRGGIVAVRPHDWGRSTDGALRRCENLTGLELAKMVKLPDAVLDRARLVSMTLASLARDGQERARLTKLTRRRKVLLEVNDYLDRSRPRIKCCPCSLRDY